MKKFPFDIVGFDLDGTLVDSAEDLRAACNHALALEGIAPLSLSQIRGAIGGGGRQLLKKGIELSGRPAMSTPRFDILFDALTAYYATNIAVRTALFPGAVAALDALGEFGVKLAVITNKREHLAERLLLELGLRKRFAIVLGGDTLGPGRSKPAPDLLFEMLEKLGGGQAAYVGDTHFDIDAARAAGMPSIAVTFGFSQRPVEDLGADAIITHYDELVDTLRTLR
ncbi:MAG: HAD-IA family hydrolase [Sphingorhabdus sp.]